MSQNDRWTKKIRFWLIIVLKVNWNDTLLRSRQQNFQSQAVSSLSIDCCRLKDAMEVKQTRSNIAQTIINVAVDLWRIWLLSACMQKGQTKRQPTTFWDARLNCEWQQSPGDWKWLSVRTVVQLLCCWKKLPCDGCCKYCKYNTYRICIFKYVVFNAAPCKKKAIELQQYCISKRVEGCV